MEALQGDDSELCTPVGPPPSSPSSSPPMCMRCSSCSANVGAEMLAAVAEAARQAVKAAFEELQPALLESMSFDLLHQGDPAKPTSPGPRQPRRCRWKSGAGGETPSADPQDPLPSSDDGGLFLKVPTIRSSADASVTSAKHSRQSSTTMSRIASPACSPSMYSLGIPSMQSLQVEIADALLETSRNLRWPSEAKNVPSGARSPVSNAQVKISLADSDSCTLPNQVLSFEMSDSDGEISEASARHRSGLMTGRSSSSLRSDPGHGILHGIVSSGSPATAPATLEPCGPAVLRLLGLLRWEVAYPRASASYQWAARVVVALAMGAFLLVGSALLVGRMGVERPASCSLEAGFVSSAPLPIGAALVLYYYGPQHHQRRLEETLCLIHTIYTGHAVGDWAVGRHRFDSAAFLLVWLGLVFATCLSDASTPGLHVGWIFIRTYSVAVMSAIILCICYTLVRICRSLHVMIDAFCCDIVGTLKLRCVARAWDLRRSMLFKASVDIERCLLILCIVLALSMPVVMVDLTASGGRCGGTVGLIPGFVLMCSILYAMLRAAVVSDKCARIPSLINAVPFGQGTVEERQFTVDYVASSGAGFYIFDTRLTAAMVIKVTYVWCLVVVGVLTWAASS
mmetsp:Transcript_69441/g.201547  ORF Transcript_69441/g.201547 Transcript_69441/m.201547 type:complete len:626 (+) Transcript_69441:121-1998(+)